DAIAAATEGMNGDEIRSIFRDARADELVGRHQRPDARRLGELTGAMLMAKQQREIEKVQSLGRSAPQQARSHFVPLPRRRIETTTSARDTPDGGEPDS